MKKYIRTYIVAPAISVLFFGVVCVYATATEVRYYATTAFVETPLSYFEGSIALTKEKAMTRNHYRFEYDDRNRLVSIGFFNGKTRQVPNHTANLFVLASQIKIRHSPDREEVTFFDRFGNQVEVLGKAAKFIYELNSLGFRRSLRFEDLDGNRIENSWKIYEYKWTYKRDGSVVEDRFSKDRTRASIRPGFEFYSVRLLFNSNGKIALLQNVNRKGSLVENPSGAAQDVIETNAAGNFLAWNVLDLEGRPEKGNGPDVARGIQTFDEFGNETSLRHEDENGNPIYNAYGICTSKTQFDSTGNMIGRTFYDENGKPAPHKTAGYVSFKMFWDKTRNNRLGIEYYDINGNKTEHLERGYATIKQEYDESGNMIKLSYFDKEGDLTNRTDTKIAYVVYEYDKKRRLAKSASSDKDGVLVN